MIIAEALSLLPAIQLAVRVVGVKQTIEWARLVGVRVRGAPQISKASDIQRIAKLIRGTCRRWPLRATCLDRSLLTAALLCRRRITVTICFGFRKHEAEVKGHAWVEHNGLPLAEDETVNSTWRLGVRLAEPR
jgi:hypothetical protein